MRGSLISAPFLSYLLKQKTNIRVANVIMTEQPLNKKGNIELSQKLCDNQSVLNLCDITAQLKPVPRLLPQQQQFDQFVKEYQFDQSTPIVFFDQHILLAARAWFTFKYFGFNKVFVLDGGYQKWLNHQPAEFQEHEIQEQPKFQGKVINTSEVTAISQLKYQQDPKGDDWAIIDTRDSNRFKKGSIPGSINIEFSEYLNKDKTMKSDEDLKNVYKKNGIDLNKTRIINTCQTAKLACIAIIAEELLKTKQQILYDGSLEDWKLQNQIK
ncbi:unnamed protein product [Paramecium pentaurelia]|uniref:Rhodanese domain-containing protein n=1 Tax=Paramecium pentaurelia TaxID=43138 RepID=A0A8S1TCZ2_9CILI|nr:unnamed protein product [Paramecium pentaurelia]